MIKFITENIFKQAIKPRTHSKSKQKVWVIERHGGRYSDAWREISVSHHSGSAFRCYNSIDNSIKQGGVRITCNGKLISSRWVPLSRRYHCVLSS
ncbi:MAG: hypothetical protein AAGA18_09775 [Verrucomicrobiota bacterium]